MDIDLSNLPMDCDEMKVKKVANVKHMISAELRHDNLTGACKGDGRVKIRLSDGETLEQVHMNFRKAGYRVREHNEDAKKHTPLTDPPKEKGFHEFYHPRQQKEYELRSTFEDRVAWK